MSKSPSKSRITLRTFRKFWDSNRAHIWKCSISSDMLKNEYSLATIGVDTTENELRNVCCVMKFHFDLGAIARFSFICFWKFVPTGTRRDDKINRSIPRHFKVGGYRQKFVGNFSKFPEIYWNFLKVFEHFKCRCPVWSSPLPKAQIQYVKRNLASFPDFP